MRSVYCARVDKEIVVGLVLHFKIMHKVLEFRALTPLGDVPSAGVWAPATTGQEHPRPINPDPEALKNDHHSFLTPRLHLRPGRASSFDCSPAV